MQTTTGSLTIVGLNTPSAQVFWNGALVPNITAVRVDWEDDEQRVKLRVTDIDPALQVELIEAGIQVKKGSRHE